ncbi:MAG: hypothetical protein QOF81_3540 [Acidimicrobiaceae bacterium]|nr:hypothetical protein [Acidimicrobiaceae bacterium]
MIAGASSCSCPDCHAVCTGKFKGCAGVWARGPVPITMRPVEEPRVTRSANGTSAESKNGKATADLSGFVATSISSVPAVQSDEVELLLAEVRTLTQRLRDTQSTEGDIEAIANRLLVNLETLPDRIASAISESLAKQHQLIVRDVRAAIHDLAIEADPRLPLSTLQG